jgi:Domain of unknown function (DUF4304)
MMKAQEVFRVMMREQVAPALRELGFRGSGQSFTLPSDEYWALVGFQKSDSSSARAVKFTVNVQVAPKEEWAKAAREKPWLGSRPSPNVVGASYVPGGWSERIGLLLPVRTYRWWWVEPDRLTEPVAREVVAAIRDHGLPEMKRRMP